MDQVVFDEDGQPIADQQEQSDNPSPQYKMFAPPEEGEEEFEE